MLLAFLTENLWEVKVKHTISQFQVIGDVVEIEIIYLQHGFLGHEWLLYLIHFVFGVRFNHH